MNQPNSVLSFLSRNKGYIISVVITLILSYGFYASHYSIHIDQLMPEYYNGSILVGAGRWATPLIHLLTNWMNFAPFWHTALTAIILFCASVAWSVLFSVVSGDKIPQSAQIAFGTVFVSYPVITAQLTYPVLNIVLAYVLVPVSLCQLYLGFADKKHLVKRLVISLLALIPAVDMYESFASVYLVGFFASLLLFFYYDNRTTAGIKDYLVLAAMAVGLLLAAVIVDLIISKLVNLVICGTTKFWYEPTTKIYWLSGAPIKNLVRFIVMMFTSFVIGSISLPFLLMFLVTVVIGTTGAVLLSVKKRSLFPACIFIILCLSVVSLPLLIGRMVEFRQMQTLSVFVAFVIMLLFLYCRQNKKLHIVISCVLVVIVLNQTKDINNYAVDNFERHTYEISLLQDIGKELLEYDTQSKPVVFSAENYQLPESLRHSKNEPNLIMTQYRKYSALLFDNVLPKRFYDKVRGYGYVFRSSEELADQIADSFTAYTSYIGWAYNDNYLRVMQRLGYSLQSCSAEQKAEARKMVVANDPTSRFRIIENKDVILVQIMTTP